MRRIASALLVGAAVAALVGCGSSAPKETPEDIGRTDAAIGLAISQMIPLCGSGGLSVSQATDGLDSLIQIAMTKPRHIYDGRDMRQVLADEADYLRPCAPGFAQQLDRTKDNLGS